MADRKSMAHLKPGRVRPDETGVLADMVARQEAFMARFGAGPRMSLTEREEWTKRMVLCIVDECSEVLGQINWKHWRSQKQEVDQHEVRFEVVDLLHFVINLAIVWGMDAGDLAAYFTAKNEENKRRQENGY